MNTLNEVLKEIQKGRTKFDPMSQSEADMRDFQSLAKALIHAHHEGLLEDFLPHKNTETSHNWYDLIIVKGGLSYKGEQYLMEFDNKNRKRANEKVNTTNLGEILNNLINDINNLPSLNRFGANPEFDKWKKRVLRHIKNIFGENSDQFKEFKKIQFLYSGPRGFDGVEVPRDKITYNNGLTTAKAFLESCIEEISENHTIRLEQNTIIDAPKTHDQNKVFVVHGHDNEAKLEVARFIEKLGFEPIILHEQASGSKTIIEKIESYSNVGFGVVLYTDCDIGAKKSDSNKLNKRARQNVVFEHGFLIGKLSRSRVCALVKGNIETPSDISGIVYTSMDSVNWKIELAKEMKAAGYDVDLNKVF